MFAHACTCAQCVGLCAHVNMCVRICVNMRCALCTRLHTFVYMCMCLLSVDVCAYLSICVSVCVLCMCTHVSMCVSVSMLLCICVCSCVYGPKCMCVRTSVGMCVFLCMRVHVYMYMYICMAVHVCVCTYMSLYVCVHMCMCLPGLLPDRLCVLQCHNTFTRAFLPLCKTQPPCSILGKSQTCPWHFVKNHCFISAGSGALKCLWYHFSQVSLISPISVSVDECLGDRAFFILCHITRCGTQQIEGQEFTEWEKRSDRGWVNRQTDRQLWRGSKWHVKGAWIEVAFYSMTFVSLNSTRSVFSDHETLEVSF
jgi:hypothetical protein